MGGPDRAERQRHVPSAAWARIQLMGPDPFDRCLLYTSDAADERSSVDLGGRRIIKQKKIDDTVRRRQNT